MSVQWVGKLILTSGKNEAYWVGTSQIGPVSEALVLEALARGQMDKFHWGT